MDKRTECMEWNMDNSTEWNSSFWCHSCHSSSIPIHFSSFWPIILQTEEKKKRRQDFGRPDYSKSNDYSGNYYSTVEKNFVSY